MRALISFNWNSWLQGLDYKKLIVVAFLMRIILASAYDAYFNYAGDSPIMSDETDYTANAFSKAFRISGYQQFPSETKLRNRCLDYLWQNEKIIAFDENKIFTLIIALVYCLFGHFSLGIRILNIFLSLGSACLLFKVAHKQFDATVANIFLLFALFLPTQILYSITMSKDILRMFALSLFVWAIYGLKHEDKLV